MSLDERKRALRRMERCGCSCQAARRSRSRVPAAAGASPQHNASEPAHTWRGGSSAQPGTVLNPVALLTNCRISAVDALLQYIGEACATPWVGGAFDRPSAQQARRAGRAAGPGLLETTAPRIGRPHCFPDPFPSSGAKATGYSIAIACGTPNRGTQARLVKRRATLPATRASSNSAVAAITAGVEHYKPRATSGHCSKRTRLGAWHLALVIAWGKGAREAAGACIHPRVKLGPAFAAASRKHPEWERYRTAAKRAATPPEPTSRPAGCQKRHAQNNWPGKR